MPVGPAILGKRRAVADLCVHSRGGVVYICDRLNERLVHVYRVVDDRVDGEDIAVPRDVIRHRIHVARLRPAASEVAVLEVSGRHFQRISHPFSGREAAPRVRRVRRRMRASIHVNRPVEGAHELNVICLHLSRLRVLFLQDAGTTEAAPLVWGRVRPALVLRCSPDRFRRRVRPHASCFVEWNPQVIAERRLPETAFITLLPPFSCNIRWILRTGRLRIRRDADQDYRDEQKRNTRNPGSIEIIHISPVFRSVA